MSTEPSKLAQVEIASEPIAQATSLLLIRSSRLASQNDEIWLSVAQYDGFVTVTIRSEKVIEMLAQSSPGAGALELLTVDRIIGLHHGEFWLGNAPDGSAEYSYRLPIATTSEPADMSTL